MPSFRDSDSFRNPWEGRTTSRSRSSTILISRFLSSSGNSPASVLGTCAPASALTLEPKRLDPPPITAHACEGVGPFSWTETLRVPRSQVAGARELRSGSVTAAQSRRPCRLQASTERVQDPLELISKCSRKSSIAVTKPTIREEPRSLTPAAVVGHAWIVDRSSSPQPCACHLSRERSVEGDLPKQEVIRWVVVNKQFCRQTVSRAPVVPSDQMPHERSDGGSERRRTLRSPS